MGSILWLFLSFLGLVFSCLVFSFSFLLKQKKSIRKYKKSRKKDQEKKSAAPPVGVGVTTNKHKRGNGNFGRKFLVSYIKPFCFEFSNFASATSASALDPLDWPLGLGPGSNRKRVWDHILISRFGFQEHPGNAGTRSSLGFPTPTRPVPFLFNF